MVPRTMRRAGKLFAIAGVLGCLAPASASALETRELRVGSPAARDCAERLLPAGTTGVARERWTAPGAGYLTVRLGGDPYAPDWDLAVGQPGAIAASTQSGATERVGLWVREGNRVTIQACRLAGADRKVPLTIRFDEMPLPKPSGERISMESVAIEEPGDVARLEALGFDVTHDVDGGKANVAVYSDAEREALTANGFRYDTVTHDLAARDRAHMRRAATRARRSSLPSARDEYRQYTDYTSEMKALAAEFPNRVRSIVIGMSLEGRPIEGLEIATDVNRADDGRPVYLNIGLTHAREWPSGEFPMEFAIDLARNYDSSETIRTILDRTRVVIVPVVNPDGFVASRGYGWNPTDDLPSAVTLPMAVADQAAYKRKNCRPTDPAQASLPCENRTASGVDLNRNYGAYWGGPGSSGDTTTQSYRGPAPFSEPESRAVRDYTASVHPTVFVTSHTFTEGRWLRQPGFDAEFMPQKDVGQHYDDECSMGTMGAFTEDEPAMKALGDAMAAANEPDWISELGYETLCDITGATEDWNYFNQGTYGYTPEAKGPNFHAAYPSMVVGEYVGNDGDASDEDGMRGSFLVAGLEAGDTDNHGVIEGGGPAGATLRLQKTFQTPTCEDAVCAKGNGKPNTDVLASSLRVPASGAYEWHVNPSVRPDVDDDPDTRTPPVEAWTMTCQRAGQEQSVAQQVLIRRGERATVDWTGLCGTDPAVPDGKQELPTCGGRPITVIGTDVRDVIVATDDRDVIAAREGDDKILSGGKNDIACGGGGKDTLKGGNGADMLFGQKAADRLAGENGKDVLRGAKGRDVLNGGPGQNRCIGGSGKDSFRSC